MKKIAVGKTEFVGYGKMILNAADWYNLPQLHILIANTEVGIEAMNLEFGVVCSGDTTKDAVSGLVKMLAIMLKKNFEKQGYIYFEKMLAKTELEEYWAAYRLIDLELAKTQHDIGRTIIDAVSKQARQELLTELGMTVETDISVMRDAA